MMKKLMLLVLIYAGSINCAQMSEEEEKAFQESVFNNALNNPAKFILQYKDANPYSVLGINANASTEQVQNAFDNLSSRWSLANWLGQEDLIRQVNYIIKAAYDKIMFNNYSKSMNPILNKAFKKSIINNLIKVLINYNVLSDEISQAISSLESSKQNSNQYAESFINLHNLINQTIVQKQLNPDAKNEILNQFNNLRSDFLKELTNKILQTNKPYVFNKIGSFKIDYRIQKMAWSSQGILAYQQEHTYRIRFWDINTKQVQDFSISGWIRSFKWSPDGKMLACFVEDNEKHEIQIWDYENKTLVQKIEIDNRIENFAWSPDSNKIAIVSLKKLTYELSIYDIRSNKILIQHPLKTENNEDYQSWSLEMAWIKEDILAILFDTSKVLNIYDINLQQNVDDNSVKLNKQIPLRVSHGAHMTTNENQLILKKNDVIQIFDTLNFHLLAHSYLEIAGLSDLELSMADNIVAVKIQNPEEDDRNIIKIIDLNTKNVLKTFVAGCYQRNWSQLAWSQDPNNLYLAFVNLTKTEEPQENVDIEPFIEIEIWQGTKLK